MLSIWEMCQNGIQHHSPPDKPDSFIIFTAYFTMLSGLIFRHVEFNMCVPVSANGF